LAWGLKTENTKQFYDRVPNDILDHADFGQKLDSSVPLKGQQTRRGGGFGVYLKKRKNDDKRKNLYRNRPRKFASAVVALWPR
jgi:hypothetical protein